MLVTIAHGAQKWSLLNCKWPPQSQLAASVESSFSKSLLLSHCRNPNNWHETGTNCFGFDSSNLIFDWMPARIEIFKFQCLLLHILWSRNRCQFRFPWHALTTCRCFESFYQCVVNTLPAQIQIAYQSPSAENLSFVQGISRLLQQLGQHFSLSAVSIVQILVLRLSHLCFCLETFLKPDPPVECTGFD